MKRDIRTKGKKELIKLFESEQPLLTTWITARNCDAFGIIQALVEEMFLYKDVQLEELRKYFNVKD